MDLRKCILTKNDCYKAAVEFIPKGIMWHSTGAHNPNLKRYVGPDDGKLGVNTSNNHWNTPRPDGRKVCVHAFIGLDAQGKVCTYQTLPFDMRAWHAGGKANDSYIGFEICEDNLKNKSYFDKVYKEAVELTSYLCALYNLDPMEENVIICHQDGYRLGIASNHADVYHWFNIFGKTMDDVRKDVKEIMSSKSVNTTKEVKKEESEYKVGEDYITTVNLYVREKAAGQKKKYIHLTADGKKHATADEKGCAILTKGTTVTCNGVEIKDGNIWIKIPSGYICAYLKESNKKYVC